MTSIEDELDNSNRVYYKLYNHSDGLTIVCLQWFDEMDYKESSFYKIDGEPVKFYDEEEAINYLNSNFDKKDIDPEYYRVKAKNKNSSVNIARSLEHRLRNLHQKLKKINEEFEELIEEIG